MARVSVGKATLETRPHILYRFYDRTGVLLYIGITVDFADRMADHAKEKEWWARVDRSATKVEYYDSRRAARQAETAAIKTEQPMENDQHNEWIEVSDEPDPPLHSAYSWPLRMFVDTVLNEADEDERENELSDASHDFDGNENSGFDQRNQAAYSILSSQTWDRLQVLDVAAELHLFLTAVGELSWRDAFNSAMTERANRRSPTYRNDRAYWFLRSLAAAKASEYLNQLPGDEGDGWRDCARSAGRRRLEDIERWAAEYAIQYKRDGSLKASMCAGPDQRGSRCALPISERVVFEVCPACPATPCTGHPVWCDQHLLAAQNASLELLADDPWAAYAVAGTRELPAKEDDPWKVAV